MTLQTPTKLSRASADDLRAVRRLYAHPLLSPQTPPNIPKLAKRCCHLEAELRAENNCPVVVRAHIDAKLLQKVCNAMLRKHA